MFSTHRDGRTVRAIITLQRRSRSIFRAIITLQRRWRRKILQHSWIGGDCEPWKEVIGDPTGNGKGNEAHPLSQEPPPPPRSYRGYWGDSGDGDDRHDWHGGGGANSSSPHDSWKSDPWLNGNRDSSWPCPWAWQGYHRGGDGANSSWTRDAWKSEPWYNLREDW